MNERCYKIIYISLEEIIFLLHLYLAIKFKSNKNFKLKIAKNKCLKLESSKLLKNNTHYFIYLLNITNRNFSNRKQIT